MYTLRCTVKLLERVKPTLIAEPPPPTTALGNWYATALFMRPQVAVMINEVTLLPVFLPLAPASTLAKRFPAHLAKVLKALEVDDEFIAREVAAMSVAGFARTASRNVIGSMNEMAYLAEVHQRAEDPRDLLSLSVFLAGTPMKVLRHKSPDVALQNLINNQPVPTL